MALFHEIQKRLLDAGGSITFNYSYINYGGKAVYIEGIKKIVTVSEEEITVSADGKRGLKVYGDGLKILELELSSMIISGKIKSITEEII